jgi:hypothetical protein
VSVILFQAVRHLPSSRQEEYHRLKKQIAELEEQRKRSQQQQQQQQQQHLSKNISPRQSASASGSVKPPLKIVLTNTSVEKREVLQNTLTSANLGNGASATVKVIQQYPAGHMQEFKDVKASDRQVVSTVAQGVAQTGLNERSGHSFSADSVVLKITQNDIRTAHTAASLTQVSSKHRQKAAKETKDLDSAVRREEESLIDSQQPSPVKDGLHAVCDVHKESSFICDCQPSEGIDCDETLEQKEAKLAEIEHQLLSKRYYSYCGYILTVA